MGATRFIGCIAAKGGVGKTTSAINLAAAISHLGKKAIVVDANLTTPNVGIYLGLPIPPVTLHDVLKGKKEITDAIYEHSNGLKIVPASIAIKDAKKVDINKLSEAMNDLYGHADYVIVDGCAGLTKESLSIIKSVEEVLIITNPEMPAVTDALKTIKVCKELGKQILGVLVTKTNSKNADMPLKDIEAILEISVIGIIPEDRAIKFSQAKKEPVIYTHNKSAAAVQYKRLAADLLGVQYNEAIQYESNGITSFIMKWLGLRD